MAESGEATPVRAAAESSRVAPADLEVRTMHVFISRALQKILREASKKQTALRQSCTDVIGALDGPSAAICSGVPALGRRWRVGPTRSDFGALRRPAANPSVALTLARLSAHIPPQRN